MSSMGSGIQHVVRAAVVPRDVLGLAARVTCEQALWWHMGGRADMRPGFHAEREAKARMSAYSHMLQAMRHPAVTR